MSANQKQLRFEDFSALRNNIAIFVLNLKFMFIMVWINNKKIRKKYTLNTVQSLSGVYELDVFEPLLFLDVSFLNQCSGTKKQSLHV